jgi:hypothetical protein
MRGSLAGFFIIVYWEAVGNIIVYDGRCSHESIGLKEEFIRVLRNPKNFTQWYLRTRRIHQSSSKSEEFHAVVFEDEKNSSEFFERISLQKLQGFFRSIE